MEFDKKLSEVMLNLANHLRDSLLTNSQKKIEIEKSKYQLWNFCQETTLGILRSKSIVGSQKDAREIVQIISKIDTGLTNSFDAVT